MKTLNHTKLHELLALALDDLTIAEQSPDCIVQFDSWRALSPNGKCLVCLAGAVMQFSLEDAEAYGPYCYDRETCSRLDALDCLRRGCVAGAVLRLRGDHTAAVRLNRHITPYKRNRVLWWQQMRQLLADLQAEDL